MPKAKDNDLVTEDNEIVNRFLQHNADNASITFCDSARQANIIILFQSWSFKLPDYGKQLLNNTLFKENAKKIYVVNYDSTVSEGFLPGCYVSLNQSNYDESRFRACAYPKVYNEYIAEQEFGEPLDRFLFSFRGTLHSHPVRQRMFDALKDEELGLMVDNTKAFHTHTEHEKRQYIKDLENSWFVLCPRGSSPNSYRLYEAMSMGRCPVIISDEWLETPGPDWSSCSIRVPEDKIHDLVGILKERKHDAQHLGQNANIEWQKHFSEIAKNKNYLEQILSLHRQVKSATMTAQGYRKHWASNKFLSANNWTLKQKILRKLKGSNYDRFRAL